MALLEELNTRVTDLMQEMEDDTFRYLRKKDTLVDNYADEIFNSLDNMRQIFNNVPEKDFGKSNGIHLITQFQNIELSISAITNHNPSDSTLINAASSVKNWISSTFLPKMKGLGAHIMSVVANLATPKEWTLKGKMSAFSFADLEVEIKF